MPVPYAASIVLGILVDVYILRSTKHPCPVFALILLAMIASTFQHLCRQ